MDCFDFDCPFRANETSNCNYCAYAACPNRSILIKGVKMPDKYGRFRFVDALNWLKQEITEKGDE